MTPLIDGWYFYKLIVFPLCSLGMLIVAVTEYQTTRSKLRLAVWLLLAVSLLVWMFMILFSGFFPHLLQIVRSFVVTPLVTILTVVIWSHALICARNACDTKYGNIKKGGPYGEEVNV